MHIIRRLKKSDTEQFRNLRLSSLTNDPLSWLSTLKEEQNLPLQVFENKINYAYSEPIFGYYGLFDDNQLLAYAQLSPSSWDKKRHIATLYDVCVTGQFRRKSIGTELINFIIKAAKNFKNIEVIHLYVTSKNLAAKKFYKNLGFKKVATIPNSVKEVGGNYQNEELYVLTL